MLSLVDKYQQMIQKGTKRIILFPQVDHQEKKPTVRLQCDIKLLSSHQFRLSQQIENNTSIIHHNTHQSSQQYTTSLYNQWPHSCIGLVLCEHHQNNQTFYVYGTGTLIHNNIVLTSAQNVYCRRLNRQYTNIRFIVGVSGNKCSGIYNVMRINYPKEYIMQEEYEDYNFAVIQLYDDLSDSCGYVGWKTAYKPASKKLIVLKFIYENQNGSFNLRQITKNGKSQWHKEYQSGSGMLVKEIENKCSIVGLKKSAESEGFINLNNKIRNYVNQWTYFTQINLWFYQIRVQGCKYLSQTNWTHLTKINLGRNIIDAQGCKYLSQTNWKYLTKINLSENQISAQGCKHLSQTNWTHLITIDLYGNKIDIQGCKYLSQANWIHLRQIYLSNNSIKDIVYRLLLLSSYPNTKIII